MLRFFSSKAFENKNSVFVSRIYREINEKIVDMEGGNTIKTLQQQNNRNTNDVGVKMGYLANAQHRHDKIEAILARDVESLSTDELEDGACLLREEVDRLMARIQQKQAANDTLDELQNVLEIRYGGGFAQGIMDGVIDSIRPSSSSARTE